mmetsp:Transcript_19949/g.32453  ORF Transcript_19949/g.32453 Transcript_19949/m.32453 type:complete len:967 (+) Transcript_19949:149-3049(+)
MVDISLIVENLPLYIFSLVVAAVGGYLMGNIGKKSSSTTQKRSEADDVKSSLNPPPMMRNLTSLIRGGEQDSAPSSTTERVIIVAHSLPVHIKKCSTSGKWAVKWDDSRNWLAAMRMLQNSEEDKLEVTWVGCVDAFKFEKEEIKEIEEELKKHNCVPVWIEERKLRQEFFHGFCKKVLWRLFHYVMPQADPDFGKKWEKRWEAYIQVNKLIANVVVKTASSSPENAAIWVHGYPTLLVPEFVRAALPLSKLGVFIHTPWPTTDVVRCLPERVRIVQAMLSADIVGFHTYDYARHFLSACRRIGGLDFTTVEGGRLGVQTQSGRTVLVEISHLGINSVFFHDLAKGEEVKKMVAAAKAEHKDRQIVIGIDHLDLVKGTLIKLQAYHRFLETHDDWKDRVVLIQVLLPSWNPPEEQKQIRASVFSVVKSIKENFGPGCIKLIDAAETNLSVNQTIAYYRAADAALVSTFWDGLNLVPYEFTASQDPERPGVLILSEFMGCSRSLSGALMVNPWSLQDVADKLHTALGMKLSARKAQHAKRGRYVLGHTTQRWARKFLEDLDCAKSLQRDLSFVHVERGAGINDLVGFRKNFTRLTLPSSSSSSSSSSPSSPQSSKSSSSLLPPSQQSTAGATSSSSSSSADMFEKQLRGGATHRVFFLDYDGTLVAEENLENVDDEEAAEDYTRNMRPSSALLSTLSALTKDKRNIVFVVSGREKCQLDSWFAEVKNLGIAAEKGCFIRWPQSMEEKLLSTSEASSTTTRGRNAELKTTWENAMETSSEWKTDVLRLLQAYTERTDGSYIETKEMSLSWHYDAADPVFGHNQAIELHRYIEKIVSSSVVDITQYSYHRILEVKPKGVDKGSTILNILSRLARAKIVDVSKSLVLAAGDEASDERMFHALRLASGEEDENKSSLYRRAAFSQTVPDNVRLDPRSTITCCVGRRPSPAKFYVYEPAELVRLLTKVANDY